MAGLNNAILDHGWAAFRRQLEYRLVWSGWQLVAAPPQYASQTCPACGHVHVDNRKTRADFRCVDCGLEKHADPVAPINIPAREHRVAACGEVVQSDASAKQEPIEAIHA